MAARVRFALGFAPHQHCHAAGQRVDLCRLACYHVGQVIDHALQMRDFLFEMFHAAVGKRAAMRGQEGAHAKRRLAPLAPLR